MGLAQKVPRLTPMEYLAIERAASTKSEFYDGEMFAMAGGSPRHSLIASNLIREFGNRLDGKRCVPYTGDLRIQVEATGLFTYPDLSVICGPLQFAEGTTDTVTNPTVIVEVLSPSTEGYDRGEKFRQYRQIPSLREYLLVSQRDAHIEHFIRSKDDDWTLHEACGREAELPSPALGISVSLAVVYQRIEFLPGPIQVLPGS